MLYLDFQSCFCLPFIQPYSPSFFSGPSSILRVSPSHCFIYLITPGSSESSRFPSSNWINSVIVLIHLVLTRFSHMPISHQPILQFVFEGGFPAIFILLFISSFCLSSPIFHFHPPIYFVFCVTHVLVSSVVVSFIIELCTSFYLKVPGFF